MFCLKQNQQILLNCYKNSDLFLICTYGKFSNLGFPSGLAKTRAVTLQKKGLYNNIYLPIGFKQPNVAKTKGMICFQVLTIHQFHSLRCLWLLLCQQPATGDLHRKGGRGRSGKLLSIENADRKCRSWNWFVIICNSDG